MLIYNEPSIVIKGMYKEEADCSALLTCTAEALDDRMLEISLESAQQVKLKICVEYAVRRGVKVNLEI